MFMARTRDPQTNAFARARATVLSISSFTSRVEWLRIIFRGGNTSSAERIQFGGILDLSGIAGWLAGWLVVWLLVQWSQGWTWVYVITAKVGNLQ